jgi:hypothetical protein
MLTVKDRMAAEFALDSERRRDLGRVGVGALVDKPAFLKKTRFPVMEEQKGGRGFAPSSGGFMANRPPASLAGGKAARPAAHGHSRHK